MSTAKAPAKTGAKTKLKRPQKAKPNQVPAPRRSPEEQAMVDRWLARDRIPTVKDDPNRKVAPDATDDQLWMARLCQAMGTESGQVINMILCSGANIAWHMKHNDAINEAIAIIRDIAPKDGLEAVLASQMVATHRVAMEQLRRTMLPNQTFEGVTVGINRANKLLNTFTKQMEALNAYRGKTSEQKMTVEHVHVYEGGQAVVGAVSHGGGRGAANGKA